MNKRYLIPLLIAAALAIAGIAFAITTATVKPGQPQYADGTVMQNNTATAPIKEYSRSGTTSVNKGRTIFTFNGYTSNSWFKKADACVTNSTGVGVPVRYALGNNAATMIAPNGCFSATLNRGYTSITVTPFANTSGATATAYYWSHQRE